MEFKLPDIGEGVHEGEITKWLVKAGDTIQADQPMVEVMTDKATVEIPSPVTGTVEKLHAEEGQTVLVGKTLLTINEKGNGKTAAKPEAVKETKSAPAPKDPKEERPAPQVATPTSLKSSGEGAGVEKPVPQDDSGEKAPRESGNRPAEKAPPQSYGGSGTGAELATDEVIPFHILATPATRKLARDLNLSLKSVEGTGPHGRVTKMDVQMAHEGQRAAAPRTSHPSATGTAVAAPRAQTPVVMRGELKRIPLKGVRKKIATAMSHSKHTAAHFTYVEEVDMSEVVRLRASIAEEAKKRGVKITYLPFIIKAVIPALQEFPFLNASLDDEKQEIIVKGDYNIGIATDTPNGLFVPVIKGADRKTIWELAAEIADLSEKAKTGKIAIEDLKGGTFTLTNAGSIGGVFATPIINHPEVAILGVNAIRKRPVVKNDQIVVADVMFLSISVDHRVVDGADAARFMNRLVYFLSEPSRLVFA